MSTPTRETIVFSIVLATMIAGMLGESLFGGKILSPADVLFVEASFSEFGGPDYEPANRLLMDPVLQFQPWLEFNRAIIRQGRLPLWNSLAGFGAPHLANGQSAVFDPFHLIAYVGRIPEAHAWMAAARLWTAGLGMFLLARRWGLGAWGRWFAGLAFPLSGFLIVWLLYPVTSTAIWMPWVFLASQDVLERPSPKRVVRLSLFVGLMLLGGHIQTAAHILLAAGLYAIWITWPSSSKSRPGFDTSALCPASPVSPRARIAWLAGVGLGIGLASVQILPLGFYLARSPVWTDRVSERSSVWEFTSPRVLDAACTVLPYLFGSQRRGHPNLARAVGVQNLNESAGGFAGLATLLWLVPIALSRCRTDPRAKFLVVLGAIGFLGAFDAPLVSNVLRAIPVINVIDHRRLTLWVCFALVLLGGMGLDQLHSTGRRWRFWIGAWIVSVLGILIGVLWIPASGPLLHARARSHYERTARETLGANPETYARRAVRQVENTLRFVPRYAVWVASQLTILIALAAGLRAKRLHLQHARAGVLLLVLMDLLAFGYGLNPALARDQDRPVSEVIAYLRREVPWPGRILAVGAELPPNTLMRYGLADVRNYDSIELSSVLVDLGAVFEPDPERPSMRTSRREVTWQTVRRQLEQLRALNVQAVVGASPPPDGVFDHVDRLGDTWIGRITPESRSWSIIAWDHGSIQIRVREGFRGYVWIPEAFVPGWTVRQDGREAQLRVFARTYLGTNIQSYVNTIEFRYDPNEVRLGLAGSGLSTLVMGFLWVGFRGNPRTRKNVIGTWKADPPRVTIVLNDLRPDHDTGFLGRRMKP